MFEISIGTRGVGAPILAAIIVVATAGCDSLPIRSTQGSPKNVNKVADLHTKLGIGYMREGRLDFALTSLNKALQADPGYSAANNAMAFLQERLSEPALAEKYYKRAVRQDPNDSAAQVNYGSFLCRRNRYQDGESRFLKAIDNPLYETPELAYTNAGLCMQRAGDLAKAETYLRKALELNRRIAPALLSMSEISLEKGRELSARGYLQRYLEVARHTPRSLWLGIRVERATGDLDTASSYAMLLKSKYPDSNETRLLLESGEQ